VTQAARDTNTALYTCTQN